MEAIQVPAMRLTEVAHRLAISRAAAYRLVRSGRLRGIQVGETWRVGPGCRRSASTICATPSRRSS
jgi:excisionase family DNA binding protein